MERKGKEKKVTKWTYRTMQELKSQRLD